MTQTAPAVFLSWLLAQITPLTVLLGAILLVVAGYWGFAEAALKALSAHCGG